MDLKDASERAHDLIDRGEIQAATDLVAASLRETPSDARLLFANGRLLFLFGRFAEAALSFKEAATANPGNVEVEYALAKALSAQNTEDSKKRARDLFLKLAKAHPEDARILRAAADQWHNAEPYDTAAELWERLAAMTGEALAYYRLSETLTLAGRDADASIALRKAAALDPAAYRDLINVLDDKAQPHPVAPLRPKRGRYPELSTLQGDLRSMIIRYVMTDLRDLRFITKNTSFFTMGSCFAANVALALSSLGYSAHYMPASEDINTTFANRLYVDWLQDSIQDPLLVQRIDELMAGPLSQRGYSKHSTIEKLKEADVFILSLGVGAAFFDRETGAFVMPRPSAISLRSLSEKFDYRTTTVAENVENVRYVLNFVQRLNPGIRTVVTVSPVPMRMSFEFDSAIVADCVSKSTMRVVAHEIVASHAREHNIMYFPSFEVFRWLSGHVDRRTFGGDGTTFAPCQDIVELVVQAFVELLSLEDESTQAKAPAIEILPLFTPESVDRYRPTYFYGAAQLGEGLFEAMGDPRTWQFRGFVDTHQGGSRFGYPVLTFQEFKNAYKSGDQIVITSQFVGEISDLLARLGVPSALDATRWWKVKTQPLDADFRSRT